MLHRATQAHRKPAVEGEDCPLTRCGGSGGAGAASLLLGLCQVGLALGDEGDGGTDGGALTLLWCWEQKGVFLSEEQRKQGRHGNVCVCVCVQACGAPSVARSPSCRGGSGDGRRLGGRGAEKAEILIPALQLCHALAACDHSSLSPRLHKSCNGRPPTPCPHTYPPLASSLDKKP